MVIHSTHPSKVYTHEPSMYSSILLLFATSTNAHVYDIYMKNIRLQYYVTQLSWYVVCAEQ